jgi:hypothetical protein
MDSLCRSDAKNAERIRAMTMSDDDSINDGTECDDGYVVPREGDSKCADVDCYRLLFSLERSRRSAVR